MKDCYKKILLCLFFIFFVSLIITACENEEINKKKDNEFRVMVSRDDGVKIDGENPITVKAGEDAKFKVIIEKGHAFKSCSKGYYNQETGILTVPHISANTNVNFFTVDGNFDSDVKLGYVFRKGYFEDTTDIYPGSSVKSGTLITVSANDTMRAFKGWSYGNYLTKGGTLLSEERTFSFNLTEDYSKRGTVSIFANYIDANLYYYNLNGGVLNRNSDLVNNNKTNRYYTTSFEGGQVKIKFTTHYLSNMECASTFWDDGIFSREGYILKEYNTKPDGSGTSYSIGSKFPINSDLNPVLYCIWAKSTPTDAFVYEKVKFGYPKNVNAQKAPHWVTGESIIISEYKGNEKVVVIPEKIGDKYVTAIDTGAFIGKDIEVLIMGRRIIKVNDGAFQKCTKLDTVYYPDGLYMMNDEAFDKASYTSFKHLYVNATLAPRFSNSNVAFAMKLSRLLSSQSKNRIIVISGSSSYEGLCSKYMEDLFLDKYRVVNFGTTRTTNGAIYLEAMQNYAHKGDVIVYAPENSSYMLGERELYWKTIRDIEGMNNIYRYLDISNYTKVFSSMSDFNINYRYKMNPRMYEEICETLRINGNGDYFGTDRYGEYIYPKRKSYCNEGNYIDSYYITMNKRIKSKFDGDWNKEEEQEAVKDYKDPNNKTWCSMDDSDLKDNMNRIINLVKKTGAKVYFGFSPVDGRSLVEEANSLKWLKDYDKFIDDLYDFDGNIGTCTDYIYDHKYFYDCAYHLNDYGRVYRTYQLYKDLCNVLKIEDITGFKDCGTDYRGCIFEESEDGIPDTEWSPKNP